MQKIIVIEDDLVFCKLLSGFLEKKGYEVLQAHDAASAREIMSNAPADFALIDYRLPDEDGVQLTAYFTRIHPGIKVILMSRHTDASLENAGRVAGAAHFLKKPFSPVQVLELLK